MAWGDLVLVSIAPAIMAIVLVFRANAANCAGNDDSPPMAPEMLRAEISTFRLLTFVPLIALAWALFALIAGEGGYREVDDEIEMRAERFFWVVPALFVALLYGSLLQDVYFRRKGPEVYPFPTESGYAIRRLAEPSWYLWLACVFAVVTTLQTQSLYVSIAPPRMTVGTLFSLRSRSYEFGDVAFVRTAPGFRTPMGSIKRKKMIAVGFSDGSVWSTIDIPTELAAWQVERVAHVVSSGAGIAIERKKSLSGSGR